MRILIEGGNFVNKGAEAMVRTVQAEMARRFDDPSFFVEATSVKPGTMDQTAAAGLRVITPTFPTWERVEKAKRFLGLALRHPGDTAALWNRRQSLLLWDEVLDQVDLVVDVSGLRYSDDMAPANARRNAPLMEQARRRGKPYILLPQSFGPFCPDGEQVKICKECLPAVPLMFARDAESRRHLAALLGRDVESIPLAPDIAFNFRPADRAEGRHWLASIGLGENGRSIVCLSPNMKVYERVEGEGATNAYIAIMTRIASRFLDEGVDVLMMPHEVKPVTGAKDDRTLCELIRQAAASGGPGGGRVVAVDQPLPAEQMKSMIGSCELLVGSRFHAIIAALQSRVPVVAIGWSHKYVELLREAGLERYVLGHREADAESVVATVEEAWRHREANHRVLQERIPSLEAASAAVFDQVQRFVSSHPVMKRRVRGPIPEPSGVPSHVAP